jgi:hypothetical protein
MTQITRAYWTMVHRHVGRYQTEVQRALLKAFDVLAKGMSERELAMFLERGGVDRFILDAVPEDQLAKAFGPMRQRVQRATEQSAEATTKLLPARVAKEAVVAFDILNPKVIEAIKDLDTRVLTTLRESVREAVREAVKIGLEDGIGPKEIARGVREVVGLAPNQVRAVNNFEKALRSGDMGALTRQLRDRRFDSTVRRLFGAGEKLSESQVTRMVSQYRKRFVAFHAETVSRTATLDAVKLGQRLTWEGAIEAGAVDKHRLMKRWVGVKDDREREEHLEMEGETVPFDQPFSNGQDIPGDTDYNCRCVAYYFEASVT